MRERLTCIGGKTTDLLGRSCRVGSRVTRGLAGFFNRVLDFGACLIDGIADFRCVVADPGHDHEDHQKDCNCKHCEGQQAGTVSHHYVSPGGKICRCIKNC